MAQLRARAATAPGLARLSEASVVSGTPGAVTAVPCDSRRVAPAALFVAVPGFDTDGHRYLSEAVERGATALLVQADRRPLWEPFLAGAGLTVVSVPDTRRALAQAAAAFYDDPGPKLGVLGAPGTDGQPA